MAKLMRKTGSYRSLGSVEQVTLPFPQVSTDTYPSLPLTTYGSWNTGDIMTMTSQDITSAVSAPGYFESWLENLAKTLGVSAKVLGVAGGLLVASLVLGKSR